MAEKDTGFETPPSDTNVEEAARLLRGLRERVQRLETGSSHSDSVSMLRTLTETEVSSDTVTVTTDSSPAFTWDTDDWGHAEWG